MENNSIIAMMLFIFLIAAVFAINSLPEYFTVTQKMILYLVSILGFGFAIGYAMK